MSAVYRTIAYAAWVLAFGLSVWLAVEFHEYQPGISLGVAVLALILSAFGLILARHCAQQKDRLAMTIGIVLWAAGAVSFAITEMGYWASSYSDRHAEYTQIKSAKTRQEGMKDMAWEALRTGEVRATSAELEARIDAAKQHERWASSNGCTNATAPASREFCQGYFELKAKLASAGKLESLETRLLADKGEAKATMIHNVFAAADMLSENSSLTEKEAATLVVLTIALVLMLSRDLLLIVANPFGGAAVARTRQEASEGVTVASQVSSPVPDAPSQPETASGEGTGGSPSLEASRTPVPLPEVALETASVAKPETKGSYSEIPNNSVIPPSPEVGQPKVDMLDNVLAFPKSGKRGKGGKKEGAVARWVADMTTQVDDPKVRATSAEVRRSYVAWCTALNLHPVKQKTMSRQLGVILRRDAGKGRGPRDAKGSIFPGLLLADPRQFQRRASA